MLNLIVRMEKNLILDTDFFDKQKNEKNPIGPIMSLRKGENYIKVWGKM